WSAKLRRAFVLDFREVAPKAATRDLFVSGGKAQPDKSRHGGLAVAVPGEPAGLAELEAKYGKLGLAAVTAPAIRLARQGFPVLARIAKNAAQARPNLPADDALAAIAFLRGQLMKNEPLARTLERFAREGATPFYKGDLARAIV